MFFLSKLVLIVLLNETFAYITQDTEIILLPASNPIGAKEIPLTLKVFGQLIKLNLRRNDQIVSSASEVWKYNVKSVTKKVLELNVSSHCFYYHEDHISSAVINFCPKYGLEGHVFLENDTMEIRPFWNDLRPMCLIDDFREQTNLSFGKLYLIKRSLQYIAVSNLYHWDMFKLKRRHVRNAQHNLTIKLAVFLDATAYNMSMLLLQNNDEKLRNMIFAYVSRIQPAFNDPSLNVLINITLVYLNILNKQPSNLPVSDGDADHLLYLFCKYAKSLNFPNDNDPRHWDIALYLTGINLYEEYMKLNTMLFPQYIPERNYTITGKTYHDGACDPLLSCAIVEFHDLSEIASSVDAVYKIGSLLGLTQEQSSTDPEMYVTWSKDSRNKIEKLWDRKICFRDQAKSENIDDDDTQKTLTIELAVFFDEAAYHIYMPILNNDESKLHKMILAYVNQIQALFHHESFGVSADISLVHLEIMKTQPSFLSTAGDDAVLLSSFCQYATFLKLQDKNHHWDIALYLTEIDLYRMKNEQKDYSPIGSFYDNATCYNTSCAVVEFSTTNLNAFSGFQTVRTAAHEMGHLLGMEHDSDYINWPCSKDTQFDEHIMANAQNYRGQVTWSKCSRNVTKQLWKRKPCLRDHTKRENLEEELDHSRYHDLPGREWTAKAQCQLFLRDKDANVVALHDICQVLQCETPHKNKYFFAGPALDGTYCAHGKECRGGECVSVIEPPYIFPYCAHDNWSEWKEDSCKSSCLWKSKGAVIRRRFCKHETHKTASCSGPYYDVALCNDSSLCPKLRDPFYIYTNPKCIDYNTKIKSREEYLEDLITDQGWQEPYDVKEPWMACTIFCRDYISTDYVIYDHYPRRLEMLEVGMDPYLPDGTWCHYENGQRYYCRQHYCLPGNYSNEE